MNYGSQIDYSDKYYDEQYEYRRTLRFSHVTLPKELSKQIPSGQLLSEKEWRSLGIQMSLGWEHYATHKYILSSVTDLFRPEPNILLFRRPLGTNGQTGKVDPELAERQRRQFRKQYGLE
ncbi:cyclin-dependent kinase [Blastocystis sp. subtype 4]|uniref:cyclin-dependent kinase n=1 Tax=Blastocystis sp. subtype 4 TaxID=944170 RepID=UPI0007116740|nr:cyclin-dependent kinase [Blastocystis sp. subtype 4]KNB42891.1 cyclin-dependent kinase [Blastocystis sp. subtype 4]|eukprot:XP_014526334.1 cyclin-dependent kinase [Blastocystis sp. subtype 4]